MKVDFKELYKSVFTDAEGLELLTQVESAFIRNYMKTQAQNDKQKNNRDNRKT